ncbi:DUF421 domain-containing protein [Gracilibacillus kekensis]|uniref:Uncharacterized membrane protein YcaP, DUF421 family n=1 Tax=Gracilibacillus kekensis TaxID=1027249 RepID=A0A1M7MGN4_9BACI|nr:DUF421 domain-containing protein [Gracilibacillus kekensis]SHM89545.1 Uncharacterized membrane protein YcaP, DUF421 family [Gracilibacillus kekensis]
MDLDWIWKAILIILIGTMLLRIAGRKSISQMSLAQTVLMIGIGSLLIQPVAGKSIWVTFGVSGILVITLVVVEYAQLRMDKVESIVTGKSAILIKNGQIIEQNLKKYRITVDLLEMLLRQNSVSNISDVEWATLEPNGQLGFILKQEAQPATKKDLKTLTNQLTQLQNKMDEVNKKQQDNIFEEVANKGHQEPPPDHLK